MPKLKPNPSLLPLSQRRRLPSSYPTQCVSYFLFATSCLQRVIQPPKPAYVDPEERVASTKAESAAKADAIKTWAISEVDSKNKKKKGTLGVGNGAVFFASESDKVRIDDVQYFLAHALADPS